MTVQFLAINYHSEPDTLRLAGDLLAQEGAEAMHLVIVDNTAHLRPAPALAELARRESRVTYLVPGSNLGYFGAAAWARKQLQDRPVPAWTVITNTDIRIPDRGFVAKLGALSGAAVIGPRILSGLSGRDQNPYLPKRPAASRMLLYKRLFAWYWGLVGYDAASRMKKWLQRGRPVVEAPAGPIYAAHGAFLVFHRSYFEAGGTFDHGTFLFNEEIFVAETARRLGLTVRYEPSLVVHHAEHANTNFLTSRVVARHMADSAAYTADTWFGGGAR